MIPLVASIVCSVSIAFLLKYNEERNGDRFVVLAGNYVVATMICMFTFPSSGSIPGSYDPAVILFGVLIGTGFFLAFFAYMRSVRSVGVSIATLVARISIVLPLILSVIIFHELPTLLQSAGILVTLITIVLFALRVRKQNHENPLSLTGVLFLVILFIGIGVNDFSMKIFQEWKPPEYKPLYLVSIFGTAAVLSWIVVVIRRKRILPRDILFGGILGIPNIFSSWFLIDALSRIPAVVVYPLVNVSIVAFAVLGGIVFWREKINTMGWIIVFLAILSILLLSIPA